ncbi:MAG: secondary thiamine-phosphate synthase enzyme YjbQ [Actinomycetota bacterium]|jgi:secondary thiamine-phosphate synthase enzyme|nr:secondary thiamine-phosphate synthase enzyme YjbQ [Actinomycetota bacterium]MCL6093997.1 secondary thiamine-phosphate synthase enzyme YjbQ [Actinomycetota bacterium]MDA8167046.1 secondary thiamine-phosphate synthase enzyme YjbQ [Actinomycetota bacterium]
MEEVRISTSKRSELIDVTSRVRSAVAASGADAGICIVYVPHTTAGVTINEGADPAVRRDIVMELDKLVPLDDGYAHLEGNSAAHIKATLTGPSVTLPVAGGQPLLGTWQSVYFCEFDGPRSRRLLISVVSTPR